MEDEILDLFYEKNSMPMTEAVVELSQKLNIPQINVYSAIDQLIDQNKLKSYYSNGFVWLKIGMSV